MPGYYYSDVDDESALLFWFGDRTVRLSSLDVRDKDGLPPPAEELLGAHEAARPPGGDRVELAQGNVISRATIRRAEVEGEGVWMFQGSAATRGTLCMATITYLDSEDRAWALETFRSLQHPQE